MFFSRQVKLFGILNAALLVGVFGTTIQLRAQHEHHGQHSPSASQPATVEFKGSPYLLDTDPVTGEKLGDQAVIYLHEGRELRFVSEKTVAEFKAAPDKYLPAADQKMIARQLPFYALETCPVSSDKLNGAMGKAIEMIYMNRLVRFCCSGCLKDWKKDPAKYFAKIDEAIIKKQGPTYPLDTCVVTGKKYDPEPGKHVELIVGSRLVRLCCPECQQAVVKDPLKHLQIIDEAHKKTK